MKRPNMLSATLVKTVKTPGRYGDGRGGLGLSLLVRTAARGHTTKCWTQSVRVGAQGRDSRRRAARGVPTFAEACETVIAILAPKWKPGGKNEQNWRSTMRDYALPRLGRMPADAVTGFDVMAVLEPIWLAKPEPAGRVRRRIGAVMKWAVAQGHRPDNPAGDALSAALPNNTVQVEHRKALPHAEVGAALGKVRRSGAHPGVVLSFEFIVLTVCRSAEVRKATWDEIDRDAAVWTIPAGRMKAGRAHRVPLSDRALGVLDEARRELPRAGVLVFPWQIGVVQGHHPTGKLMRRLKIDAVPHGFRSSFRDWAAECTDTPREGDSLSTCRVRANPRADPVTVTPLREPGSCARERVAVPGPIRCWPPSALPHPHAAVADYVAAQD